MSLYCIFNDLKAKLLIESFSRIACSAFRRIFGGSTLLLDVLSCHLLSPMVSQGIKKSHWYIEYVKYEDLYGLPHHEVLLWVIYMVIRKWHWNGILCLSFWILFLPCGKNCQYQNDPEVTFYKSVHLSFAEVTFKLAEMIFYLFQDVIYQMQILMYCYSYCIFLHHCSCVVIPTDSWPQFMGLLLILCFTDFLILVLKKGLSPDGILILSYPCISSITNLPVFFALPWSCRGV